MPIDKSLYQMPVGLDAEITDPSEIEIVVADEDSSVMDDGSMLVDLSGAGDRIPQETVDSMAHDTNLALLMSDSALNKLGDQLVSDVEDDLQSRSEWEQTYVEGLELLGLRLEERSEPWDGACGVVHPLLLESVVKFQSETIVETFPASGPVKTKVLGDVTPEKEAAARRVQDDMNHEIVDVMTEYRLEHERLLLNLPTAGSALKKVYYDPILRRQTSMFVSAEDFIVSYGATDLHTCPRYTHRIRHTTEEVEALQASGTWLDVDLGDPVRDSNSVRDAKDKLSGIYEHKESRHTFYEVHADLVLDEIDLEDAPARPYVVTIEKSSRKIVSIRRNWDEEDPSCTKIPHFAHYQYVTGFGFYGFGLIHLVGGYAKGATSLLRQLVDAGTLSNLPGGLKTKGMRIKGEDDPIGPGEWRDVDVPAGTLRDNLMALPYKEPSQVLATLLDRIIADGRKMAAVAEMDIANFDSNAPVGTTLALLERTLKVMSAIQARVYASMKDEFRLLKGVIEKWGEPTYSYSPDGAPPEIKQQDYASTDVLPVADPNASTMAQKIVQWQAVIQMAQMAPQVYDVPQLHSRMIEAIGIKNVEKLIPSLKSVKDPVDPVSENMAIMMGKPVKAFAAQDHKSHIAVHQAAMQDPKIQAMVGQNPQAPIIMAAAHAHLMEHIAYEYRNQIEQHLGTQLPPPESPLSQEIEYQLSGLMAQASQKLLDTNKSEVQQQQANEQMKDPLVQIQMEELELKKQEIANKKEIEDKKLMLETVKLMDKSKSDARKQRTDLIKAGLQSSNAEKQRKSATRMGIIGHAVDLAKERQRMTRKPKGGSE